MIVHDAMSDGDWIVIVHDESGAHRVAIDHEDGTQQVVFDDGWMQRLGESIEIIG